MRGDVEAVKSLITAGANMNVGDRVRFIVVVLVLLTLGVHAQ